MITDDRNVLMEILNRAGFDCTFEYTFEGEIMVVKNRYNGYSMKMMFDGEGKLVDMDSYRII